MRRGRLGRASDRSHHLQRSAPKHPPKGSVHPSDATATGKYLVDGPGWETQGDDSCACGTHPLRGWATRCVSVTRAVLGSGYSSLYRIQSQAI